MRVMSGRLIAGLFFVLVSVVWPQAAMAAPQAVNPTWGYKCDPSARFDVSARNNGTAAVTYSLGVKHISSGAMWGPEERLIQPGEEEQATFAITADGAFMVIITGDDGYTYSKPQHVECSRLESWPRSFPTPKGNHASPSPAPDQAAASPAPQIDSWAQRHRALGEPLVGVGVSLLVLDLLLFVLAWWYRFI